MMDAKLIVCLKKLKFQRFDNDGVDYYKKQHKHRFIKNLHVVVDGVITIYGTEPNERVNGICNGGNGDYVIHQSLRTIANIEEQAKRHPSVAVAKLNNAEKYRKILAELKAHLEP